jgi:hypothetical protein
MEICRRQPDPAGKSTGSPGNGQTVRPATRAQARKVAEFTLPGKAPKENSRYPYHKPTQVDEESIQRRSDDGSFRN